MSVFPLMRLLRCSFLAASLFSWSMAASTTSLSSARSKKVPAYSRMLSGLSSNILRTNNPNREFISGCYLKYFSFSILSSSYNITYNWYMQPTFFFSISFFWALTMPSTPIRSWLLLYRFSACWSASPLASSPYSICCCCSYSSLIEIWKLIII